MLDEDDAELLRQARDELYMLRTITAPLRNRAAQAVAALTDSQERTDALIARLEARFNGSHRPKEAQGHEQRAAPSTTAHE